MLQPPGAALPLFLKHFISLANKETERGKDENSNNLLCTSISTRGGDSRVQKATYTIRGGTPVCVILFP